MKLHFIKFIGSNTFIFSHESAKRTWEHRAVCDSSGRCKFIRDTTYILGSICSIHMTSVDFDEPGFLFLFHIYLLIFQNGSSVMIDVATGGRSHHQNEQVR